MWMNRWMRDYDAVLAPAYEDTLRRKIAALRSLSPGLDPAALGLDARLAGGLVDHTLFACKQAAETRDGELARRALALWSRSDAAPPARLLAWCGRSWLTVDANLCLRRPEIDARFDAPCYIVSDEALSSSAPRGLSQAEFDQMGRLLEASGLSFLADRASAILVMLRYRTLDESLTGYTLYPFVGTNFTDWTVSPLRMGECLLHEAAHTWLNLLVRARRVQPRTSRLYPSPWRGVDRPAIGIVHGAWAFSIVYLYYDRLARLGGAGLLPDKQVRYCHDRRRYELLRLRQVAPFIEAAIGDVGDRLIREGLIEIYPGFRDEGEKP
jgi:hypothetical protein